MHLLFDLDGTLTDSFVGIGRCINHALVELGRDPVPEAALRGLVGAPLTAIFGGLMDSNDEALLDRAVAAYRSRFHAVGIFENQLYPGIHDALGVFRAAGHHLRVVTAKPAVSARRVVRHFAIEGLFDGIHGPALGDRTCDKADLVRDALRTASAGADDALMVGDRAEDIAAARAHGVRAVGAGWGYGARTELLAAAPDYLAETVADLVSWVDSAR